MTRIYIATACIFAALVFLGFVQSSFANGGTVCYWDGCVTFGEDNGTWLTDSVSYGSAAAVMEGILTGAEMHENGVASIERDDEGLITSIACINGVTAVAEYGSCVADTGSSCTSAANSCGMTNGGGTISCDGSCTAAVPSDTLCSSSVSDSCTPTSTTCGSDGNLHNDCGGTSYCSYGCDASTNQCKTRCSPYNICDASGTKVVNSCDGSLVDDCAGRGEGWICQNGACIAPAISLEPFSANGANGATGAGDTFQASGHLQVRPSLVNSGETTRVYWNVKNAKSCTISGDNGDSWSGSFSGTAGKTTSRIVARTAYTLYCQALPGATPSSVQESATVDIVPVFEEQ